MPLIWQGQQQTIVGCQDHSVSPYLKAWIKQGDKVVCGLIGEGTTLTLASNWDSPFEHDNLDSMFQKASGVMQLTTGVSFRTTANSAQVWSGDQPARLSLTLVFVGINDAVVEVEDALTALKEFKSPQSNALNPISLSFDAKEWGRIPSPVSVNIGRNFIYPDMLITDYSEQLGTLTDANGNRLEATIQLSLESRAALNRTEMQGLRA